jgi:hypothetical protein
MSLKFITAFETDRKDIEQFCTVFATAAREFSVSEEKLMSVVYQFIIAVIFKL